MTKRDGDRLRAIELELREISGAYDPLGRTSAGLDAVGIALSTVLAGGIPNVSRPIQYVDTAYRGPSYADGQ